jgi:hypothetical protein
MTNKQLESIGVSQDRANSFIHLESELEFKVQFISSLSMIEFINKLVDAAINRGKELGKVEKQTEIKRVLNINND